MERRQLPLLPGAWGKVWRVQNSSSTCKINFIVRPMHLRSSIFDSRGNWPEKPQTLQAHSIDHSCTTWPADVYSVFSCLQREQLLVFDACRVASQEASSRETCLCFLHNKTGWADHMASEVAARKCSHRLHGLRLCRLRNHSTPSSSVGKQGNSLTWFISSALIHWPVLLWVLSVVWAKPAWEELQGKWLYCKFNQRKPPKVQSVVEQIQAVYPGLSL